MARLVGVSTTTVSNWEAGSTEPEVQYLPALLDFLGYDPEPEPTTLGERVAWHQRRLGLARSRLATLLRVDPASVRKVEAGRSVGRALSDAFTAFLSHCDAVRDLATLALPQRRAPNERPVSLDTVGDHIRARRLDLGLSIKDAAKRLECSVGSLSKWELGRRAASIKTMPAILAFLGYDPFPPPATLAELLHAIRRERGITQLELASLIGVAESTVTGWETQSTEPTGRGAPKLWRFLERECPAALPATALSRRPA